MGGGDNSILETTARAAAFSATAGGLFGAISAGLRDLPVGTAKRIVPSLVASGGLIWTNALVWGSVGGLFAGTELAAASVRGKHDKWNGALAGLTAGAAVGAAARSVKVGAGASAALAAMSLFVDTFGDTLVFDKRVLPSSEAKQ